VTPYLRAASTAPATIALGAWSPPIASSAIFIMTQLWVARLS